MTSIPFNNIEIGHFIILMSDLEDNLPPDRVVVEINFGEVKYKKISSNNIHTFSRREIKRFEKKKMVVVDRNLTPEYFL